MVNDFVMFNKYSTNKLPNLKCLQVDRTLWEDRSVVEAFLLRLPNDSIETLSVKGCLHSAQHVYGFCKAVSHKRLFQATFGAVPFDLDGCMFAAENSVLPKKLTFTNEEETDVHDNPVKWLRFLSKLTNDLEQMHLCQAIPVEEDLVIKSVQLFQEATYKEVTGSESNAMELALLEIR